MAAPAVKSAHGYDRMSAPELLRRASLPESLSRSIDRCKACPQRAKTLLHALGESRALMQECRDYDANFEDTEMKRRQAENGDRLLVQERPRESVPGVTEV